MFEVKVLKVINMEENAVICAQNLNISYGNRAVVKDVSFTINSGEFVGLLGANGAGKTTLFRAIMGLIPHTGKLEVRAPHMEGAKLNSRVSYVGYVLSTSRYCVGFPTFCFRCSDDG